MNGDIIKHMAIEQDRKNHKSENKFIEFIFHLLTMIVLFLEIYSHLIHDNPIINLEIKNSDKQLEYSIIGIDSDQDYSLEYIKIYPKVDSVKQATFKYAHYKDNVDLKVSQKEQPTAYIISKQILQDKFGTEGFHFAFSKNNNFEFTFLFEENTSKEPEFECQVVAFKENTLGQFIKENIPCEVTESTSFFYIQKWAIGIAIFLFVLIWYLGFLNVFKKLKNHKITNSKADKNIPNKEDVFGNMQGRNKSENVEKAWYIRILNHFK